MYVRIGIVAVVMVAAFVWQLWPRKQLKQITADQLVHLITLDEIHVKTNAVQRLLFPDHRRAAADFIAWAGATKAAINNGTIPQYRLPDVIEEWRHNRAPWVGPAPLGQLHRRRAQVGIGLLTNVQ